MMTTATNLDNLATATATQNPQQLPPLLFSLGRVPAVGILNVSQ